MTASTCYELYRVTLRYNDLEAGKKWEKENEDVPDDDLSPTPDPITVSTYIAIRSGNVDWHEGPGRAAELALLTSVGAEDCWERYEPVVLLVELVDDCIKVDV